MNTNNWKEFKVGELGFEIIHGSRIKKADRLDGSLIFLTAGKENSGIAGTIGNDVNEWSNPITIDMFGNCFYHPYKCYGDDNIYAFINDNLSHLAKYFIATTIQAENNIKYSFNDQFRQKDAENVIINLPATPSGDPDWVYMEAYMKEMEEKAKERLDRLEEMRKQKKKRIDVSGWGEFKVGELFDATRGKSRRMQILEDGDIPLIAAARNNRGIAGTYNTDAEYENSITVSCNGVGCGSAFYHNYPFSITGDAIVLEEKKDMSDYIKQFIASIIDASFTNKYSYEEKCSADKAKNETILLPVTSAGDPDWAYMEQYMREMEEKVRERLEKLGK